MPFFLGDAEGNLLGFPVRETLPPDVNSAARVGGEVHPLPVGGPGGVGALRRRRTDRASRRAAVRRQSAGRAATN